MCRRVDCGKCGKPTFAGCGAHIEQVLGDVPKDQRCQCNAKASNSVGSETKEPTWLRSFFGKM